MKRILEEAYVQVYTGNGKGKTTCALGIALRMLCAGGSVYMGQFLKGQSYSELRAMELLDNIEIEQFGDVSFVMGKPSDEDAEKARAGFRKAGDKLLSGSLDMVILDEINTIMQLDMVKPAEVIDLLERRPAHTEVILTGRGAPDEIIEFADLVTEMKEIKHYYRKGVMSRAGIED